ncbi:MAG: uroporphyrinogen-III synthase [Candidatus Tectomicrobia bacterium]|uniref:Uroporphyrinogen-III synthase n=1 Tax=Tectimicrobiota bacterium TaxID=2528274 RepID=A0A932MQ44_UNCTE|nr:uroporphyrinogen-III synthase [Candidatus Tectomicrobia bacterium]
MKSALPEAGKRPLAGRRIVVTRPAGQAGSFASLLEEMGAEPVVAPLVEIGPPEDWAPLDAAIGRLNCYHWVIFTSANGVIYFAERLAAAGKDAGAVPSRSRIMAIGPATAKAVEASLCRRADAMPAQFVAEGILALLNGEDMRGKRVLIPRAAEAREILPDTLRERGAEVDVVHAYRTLPAPPEASESLRRELAGGRIDMVAFTSSSTVWSFARALGSAFLREHRGRFKVASIGPVTTGTARELGLDPEVEAGESTTPGLAGAIAAFYAGGTAR